MTTETAILLVMGMIVGSMLVLKLLNVKELIVTVLLGGWLGYWLYYAF